MEAVSILSCLNLDRDLIYCMYLYQVEKRKLFNIFLKQFLVVYQNWEPVNEGQSPEDAVNSLAVGNSEHSGQVVVGCSAGHPAEIIQVLIEEVTRITSMVMECKFILHQ